MTAAVWIAEVVLSFGAKLFGGRAKTNLEVCFYSF